VILAEAGTAIQLPPGCEVHVEASVALASEWMFGLSPSRSGLTRTEAKFQIPADVHWLVTYPPLPRSLGINTLAAISRQVFGE